MGVEIIKRQTSAALVVRRRSKSRGRGLSLRPVVCSLALSVTYSAATAAVVLVTLHKCYAFTFFTFLLSRGGARAITDDVGLNDFVICQSGRKMDVSN